jgi:hypothetical protein
MKTPNIYKATIVCLLLLAAITYSHPASAQDRSELDCYGLPKIHWGNGNLNYWIRHAQLESEAIDRENLQRRLDSFLLQQGY